MYREAISRDECMYADQTCAERRARGVLRLTPTLHIAAQNFKSEGFNCASRSNYKIFKPSILKPEMPSTKAQAQKASSAISPLLLGQSRKLEAPMPLTLDRPRRMLVVMDVSEVSCVWRVSGGFFRKLPKVETP